MFRSVLIIATVAQLTAFGLPQAPVGTVGQEWDPNSHGEHSLPEGHYCMNHKPEVNPKTHLANPRAHECHCDYVCVPETSDYYPYYPTSDCLVFCKKANVQCTCHPEEPCPHPPKTPTISPDGLSKNEWLRQMGVRHDELKHGGQPFKKE